MTSVIYKYGHDGDYDWEKDEIRALVLGGASVPARCYESTLTTVADLLAVDGARELDATNYTRRTTTRKIARNALMAAVIWPSIGGSKNDTMRAFVFYKDGATDAFRKPICICANTKPITTNGGDIVLEMADIIQ